VRERVRYLHYSLQTEKVCVYWGKVLVLWAARSAGSFRRPCEMGQTEVEGFLAMLGNEKQLAPATHQKTAWSPRSGAASPRIRLSQYAHKVSLPVLGVAAASYRPVSEFNTSMDSVA